MRNVIGFATIVGGLALVVGCEVSLNNRPAGFGGDGGGNPGSGGAAGASSSSSDGVGGNFVGSGGGGGSGAGGPMCSTPPDVDDDGDGFTEMMGDCNDCDANVNPGAIEVVNDDPASKPADEDCDGMADNPLPTCDDNLALEDPDPMNAARAIDLCKIAAGPTDWGVISSQFVRADGTPTTASAAVGILSNFGPNVNVQVGQRMFALSSGRARLPGQPNECMNTSCMNVSSATPPPGFPQDVPNCSGSSFIRDDAALEVKLRAPKNANGYAFNFKFYSFEYPYYVCTAYNDQFIALANPAPMGSIGGNISFDTKKNPVSVNIAFFDVCDFNPNYPQYPCALGSAELQGTGFDTLSEAGWGMKGYAGGTVWLATQAPITGGEEFSIRLAIWDTGDQALDSTALVDGFKWLANGGTVTVGTEPVPVPK